MINIYWLKCCQNASEFHLGLRVFIYYYYFIFCVHTVEKGEVPYNIFKQSDCIFNTTMVQNNTNVCLFGPWLRWFYNHVVQIYIFYVVLDVNTNWSIECSSTSCVLFLGGLVSSPNSGLSTFLLHKTHNIKQLLRCVSHEHYYPLIWGFHVNGKHSCCVL